MTEVTVTVNVPSELSRDLSRLSGGARRAITEGAAMGMENAILRHFLALHRKPRKDGFQPSGFWFGTDGNSVAEQIEGGGELGSKERPAHVMHDDGHASVTIDDPRLVHKIEGGTIKPIGHKYLTIPANNEAAQAPQGARSFATDIEWVEDEDGVVRPALVAASNYVRTSRSRKTGEVKRKVTHDEAKANAGIGDVLFWLVRKVKHQPMADALPSGETLGDAAREAALDALDALLATKGDAA